MSRPKFKKYEIALPVKETWIFEVRATSKKEALRILREGVSDDIVQTCSLGGWPHSSRGATKIIGERDEE